MIFGGFFIILFLTIGIIREVTPLTHPEPPCEENDDMMDWLMYEADDDEY